MNISRLVAFNTSLTRMSILSKIRVTFIYYYCIGFLLLIHRVCATLICSVLIFHSTVCRNDLRWHCQPNIYSRWAELLPTWCQSRSALDGDHNCFELEGLFSIKHSLIRSCSTHLLKSNKLKITLFSDIPYNDKVLFRQWKHLYFNYLPFIQIPHSRSINNLWM